MSQEVWIPFDFGGWKIPEADQKAYGLSGLGPNDYVKTIIPDRCPFCGEVIPIKLAGNKGYCFGWGPGSCYCPKRFKELSFEYMWTIRLEPREVQTAIVNITPATIGHCDRCGLPNEYQSGPYTCFSCRQDPYR